MNTQRQNSRKTKNKYDVKSEIQKLRVDETRPERES